MDRTRAIDSLPYDITVRVVKSFSSIGSDVIRVFLFFTLYVYVGGVVAKSLVSIYRRLANVLLSTRQSS